VPLKKKEKRKEEEEEKEEEEGGEEEEEDDDDSFHISCSSFLHILSNCYWDNIYCIYFCF
jgi:hypothetical protein